MDSHKFIKKVTKKLRRLQYILNKETGAVSSSTPTQNLAICNVGQINGLTEATIVEAFKQYGPLERVLLIPGKSCAFLSYKSVVSATRAFEDANGKLNIAQDEKPAYLSYVESLPESKNDKIWDRLPPGLTIIENFVTEAEEAMLLSLCMFEDDVNSMKHRQVKHYGYEFRYDINNVDKDKPLSEKIPQECDVLWRRLNIDFRPDQLTINHYKPGQGIPAHIDTHSAFEDPILSLSLNSAVVMEFKQKETICVLLPQRSLAIISGECRYDWTHAIIPRKYDFYYTSNECNSFKRDTRVSFTFRKILRGECSCNYKLNCDSYAKNLERIDHTLATKLESQHVHEVYEDIAGHFSDTRHKPWPNVLDFLKTFKTGSILVDIGCGNGKYFGYNREIFETIVARINLIFQVGMDRSFKLNELCKGRGFEIFTGNCLNLPLKNNTADGVISIAVIHHLATKERRLKALTEITRILRPGGLALIYVWAKQQMKNQEKSTYIKQDRKNRKSTDEEIRGASTDEIFVVDGISLPVHINRTDFNHSDVLVPWKLKSENLSKAQTFLRFYHVFEEGELDNLCEEIPEIT
ncbi:alkylated DNA repair protein alkB -like 8, partial [Asbolus verrucosus]